MIKLSNKNIRIPVVDSTTGYVDFPIIKEDATETYLHNFATFMNKIIEQDTDKPKSILIVGNSTGDDMNLEKTDIHNRRYSHVDLQEADVNKRYTHEVATDRQDYTVGNATVVFMKSAIDSDENGILINDQNIGFSFDLGKPFDFYPDEYIFLARRMNTLYKYSNYAYSTSKTLPSYIRLRCVQQGTTSNMPFSIGLKGE